MWFLGSSVCQCQMLVCCIHVVGVSPLQLRRHTYGICHKPTSLYRSSFSAPVLALHAIHALVANGFEDSILLHQMLGAWLIPWWGCMDAPMQKIPPGFHLELVQFHAEFKIFSYMLKSRFHFLGTHASHIHVCQNRHHHHHHQHHNFMQLCVYARMPCFLHGLLNILHHLPDVQRAPHDKLY